ncbi:MAG: thiamine pyrophosphate-binding protein [Verrucomicrobia bacterium]|nr:thiamine pyrophosphate-binding protein [Verrucomicrobiota bacterium]
MRSEDYSTRTGAQLLVDILCIQGVDTIFCVPGESYLAMLDALRDTQDKIKLIVCRHEGAAANMADAYGKLTGTPGICIVTRGPGAAHASIGVHTAKQDSTPMILLIGQIEREFVGREAFQEIDYRFMFAPLTKWVAEIDRASRVPELVSRAFQTAVSGRPGPVALALPEDMLTETATVADVRRYKVVRAHPGPTDLINLHAMLARAQRPLLLLGGGGWDQSACADIAAFAEANRLPTAVAFRFQDLFDNRNELYIGDVGLGINPRLALCVRDADLLLVVGPRLSEATTGGYELLKPPRLERAQQLVHVHADPEELSRVYQADLPINAGMSAFAAAARQLDPVESTHWQSWLTSARQSYLQHIAVPDIGLCHSERFVDMSQVVKYLRERLPADAIIVNGAGNYTTWIHRFYQYRTFRTQLAPTSGAMGYGLPAAIAAKLQYPERVVVAFAGDGCFLMYGQELATAMQYKLNIVILVVNNFMYGTIRMHQERKYPGRVYGTELLNPDFAAFARAFGAQGKIVDRTEDFPPAFEEALTAETPWLLELRVDPDVITPYARLSEIRIEGMAHQEQKG